MKDWFAENPLFDDHANVRLSYVGGASNVLLGIVALTENLRMVVMAIWMLTKVSGLAA